MNKVLILGGYGNFGKRIARALVMHGVPVIIAGRSHEKAESFNHTLPSALSSIAVFDVKHDLSAQLKTLKPVVAINTCGPFQTSNYNVAQACIEAGVHYIDLADGRDFVTGINTLDQQAKQKSVVVISGASTLPGLSSAVLEKYKDEFSEIESLVFGISPGQRAQRGLATTQAIMTYVGKPLKVFAGINTPVYGWQNIYLQEYPELGKRWMANCDIPDLDLLPLRYGIRSIRFSAGLELSFMHIGLWLSSWLVRAGVPLNLLGHATTLLKISNWFNGFGTADGGMHMIIRGKDKTGNTHVCRWFIIGKNGAGPQIPCIPAIILAKKLASAIPLNTGAYPCVGLISLEEYLSELKNFDIRQMRVLDG